MAWTGAPIAQLDRAFAFEAKGSRFESWWAQSKLTMKKLIIASKNPVKIAAVREGHKM